MSGDEICKRCGTRFQVDNYCEQGHARPGPARELLRIDKDSNFTHKGGKPAPATADTSLFKHGASGRFESVEPKLRFNTKWILEPNTGCWLWTSNVSGDGYGYFRFDNKRQSAHRIAWVLFKGEIPEGMHVCHRCDRPTCVNPEHLFLGTARDNKQDSVNKGRSKKNPKDGRWTK